MTKTDTPSNSNNHFIENDDFSHTEEWMNDNTVLWNLVVKELKGLVSPDAFERWFESATLVERSETEAVIAVETDMHQVWIETNYLPEVEAAFSQATKLPYRVKVVEADELIEEEKGKVSENGGGRSDAPPSSSTDNESKSCSRSKNSSKGTKSPSQKMGRKRGASSSKRPEAVSDEEIQKKLKNAGLNPQFSFSRFVVGQNNEFAQAACEAVASSDQAIYNPLFIHGDSGLGKTHLMQAIGQRMMKNNPSARVVYLTCEKFTNEFIDALRKKTIEKFRRKYRRADILLIDDIQFLGGKERSQEEFFHTFNELLDLQNQIVLTSDRPASEIKNIEPRLVSRFESGLSVELLPPGEETRLAILRSKMEDWDVKLNDDILHMLAEKIQSNVRRLEGGLVRVATYASLGSEPITVERAEVLLKDILREEGQKKVSIDCIQKAVSNYFDIRIADMTSQRRPANIAFPRQIAMYLSRHLTNSSLVEIGDAFGGRDHGTVIYACKKVKKVIENDLQTRDTLDILTSDLQRK